MTTRNGLLRMLLVLLCLGAAAPAVSAQNGIQVRYIPTTTEIQKLRRMLSESVHLSTFQGPLTLRDALERLYEQLAARGVELPISVDQDTFREVSRRLDVLELPVRFPSSPRRVSVREFLQLVLDQVPVRDITLAFRPFCVEITTAPRDVRQRTEEAARKDAAVRKARALFREPVNLRDFRGALTMKEALSRLYDQLSARGIEVAFLVDAAAFARVSRRLEVWDLPVQLPSSPRQVSVGTLLRLLVAQIPTGETVCLFRFEGDFVEFTTARELAQERASPWRSLVIGGM